jgi:hypothetical protein
MPTRRAVILGAGSAGLALVGSGATWAVTRQPKTALAPWALADKPPADVRLDAFRHAILAPNPHNRQPWQIRLAGDDTAIVTCDLDKRLPATDPFDRQIVIGFGAFVELAVLAGTLRGQRVDVVPFPEGANTQRLDGRPIAWLTFAKDPHVVPSPLAKEITKRRSVKKPFDVTRPLLDTDTAVLATTAGDGLVWRSTRAAEKVAAITSVALDAWRLEARTHRTMKESVDLMRIGAREVDHNPDGIALRGPMIEALRLSGGLTRPALLDPTSSAFATGEKLYDAMLKATASHAWLTSRDGGRHAQFEAGRAYMRFTLEATRLGLSVHPISQALQEFPEMKPHFGRMRSTLEVRPDETLQMLVRIGYGPSVEPAPRWPLSAKLGVA